MGATAPSVLTVEDDPIVRAELRLVLEDAGFSVCADAQDGVAAVELAREQQPDVILLDLGLPRMDGIEATRRILAERDVPIVALTGRSHDLAEQAVREGATSYLQKPFSHADVVSALLDALAIHAGVQGLLVPVTPGSLSRVSASWLISVWLRCSSNSAWTERVWAQDAASSLCAPASVSRA